MLKKYGVACLILIASFVPLGSASAVTIGFSPSSSAVNVGDNFDVDVVISDLFASDGSREIVSAFDLDVTYDNAVLNATSVTFGSSLGAVMSTDFFDFFSDAFIGSVLSAGRIDFFESSWLSNDDLLALQTTDNFTLATLSFEALAEGSSSLLFDPTTFPGVDVKGLDPWVPFDLNASTGTGNVAVVAASVSEPGILLLMVTGLLGLAIAYRKPNKRFTR